MSDKKKIRVNKTDYEEIVSPPRVGYSLSDLILAFDTTSEMLEGLIKSNSVFGIDGLKTEYTEEDRAEILCSLEDAKMAKNHPKIADGLRLVVH